MTNRRRALCWMALLGGSAMLWFGARSGAQEQAPTQRQFNVSARKYAFAPSRIEVRQGDIVQVNLTSEDIAHSFTVDEYRIAKRVAAGQSVSFEFRADQPGTFRIYCNLMQDEGCRNMHGELAVR
jgi:heme/copper-type cytochrome/quinol oxidase subunit 2